jgi:4a-hydroxytetrahydrobiopterin dehydratase
MDLYTFLAANTQWSEENQTLVGEFRFDDFSAVCAAVQRSMQLANELDHHPEVTFGYNTLKIALTSHDADDTITDKDIDFAQKFTEQPE